MFPVQPVQPVPPVRPSHQTRPSASFCENVYTGPRRDIVVDQSLKCTVQSAQVKPHTKTQMLCPPPSQKIKIPHQNSKFIPPTPQKMNF